jgi:hypothetical protein
VAPGWLRVIIGALLVGFLQAQIQLFFHEAAHYNLAPGRERNGRLANLCVGAIHGLEIGAYRIVHFEHHRRLGTRMDSERSYFDPLNLRFVAEAMLGIKGLKVLSRRETLSPTASAARAARRQRIIAAVIHLGIVGVGLSLAQYALAFAWTLGTLSVMPLFASLRQLLEHRSEHADASIGYATLTTAPSTGCSVTAGPRCLACASRELDYWATAHDVEHKTVPESFTYYRCRRCEALSIDPVPEDRLGEIYPPTYYSFTAARRSVVDRVKETIDRGRFRKTFSRLSGAELSALDVALGDLHGEQLRADSRGGGPAGANVALHPGRGVLEDQCTRRPGPPRPRTHRARETRMASSAVSRARGRLRRR